MNRWLLWFCRLVLLLEWIPAYRRTFTWISDEGKGHPGPTRWSWFRPGQGMWGIRLLQQMGLFWRYLGTLDWVSIEVEWEEEL